jgi:hypothetical protein
MTDPLWSARLKLARASEHLKSLDEQVRSLSHAEADRAIAAQDFGTDQAFTPTMGDRDDVEDSLGLGVILGDFLSNLRAALDHAANGLASPARGEFTKFPIYTDRRKFRRDADANLAGVSDEHRADIERMQPYTRSRRGRVLKALNDLVNIDKHRVVKVVELVADISVWVVPSAGGRVKTHKPSTYPFPGLGSFIDFDTESQFRVQPLKGESDMEADANIWVLFGNANGGIVASRRDLRYMLDEVTEILSELSPAILSGG